MFSILKKYLSQSIFKFLSSFSKLISFDLKKGSPGFQFILSASSYFMYKKNYLEENIYQLHKIYELFNLKKTFELIVRN